MSDAPAGRPVDPTFDTSAPDIAPDFERALRADYERSDARWSKASQIRDALIIFAIGVFVFLWMFIVFLLEPGIR